VVIFSRVCSSIRYIAIISVITGVIYIQGNGVILSVNANDMQNLAGKPTREVPGTGSLLINRHNS
jgi:hypothetical protein